MFTSYNLVIDVSLFVIWLNDTSFWLGMHWLISWSIYIGLGSGKRQPLKIIIGQVSDYLMGDMIGLIYHMDLVFFIFIIIILWPFNIYCYSLWLRFQVMASHVRILYYSFKKGTFVLFFVWHIYIYFDQKKEHIYISLILIKKKYISLIIYSIWLLLLLLA